MLISYIIHYTTLNLLIIFLKNKTHTNKVYAGVENLYIT